MTLANEIVVSGLSALVLMPIVRRIRRKLSIKRAIVQDEPDEPRETHDPIGQRMEFHGNLVERLDEELSPERRRELEAQMSRLRNLARYRVSPLLRR